MARFRPTTLQDVRSWLAQAIYLMDDPTKREFRETYPPGIPDEMVGEALAFADTLTRKRRKCSPRS